MKSAVIMGKMLYKWVCFVKYNVENCLQSSGNHLQTCMDACTSTQLCLFTVAALMRMPYCVLTGKSFLCFVLRDKIVELYKSLLKETSLCCMTKILMSTFYVANLKIILF